jgi:hypothetical protein
MRFRFLLVGLTVAQPVYAQLPTRMVSGLVFDSVARSPLSGAIVQVVAVDSAGSARSPRVFSGTTDDHGRYRIAGLPPGRFAIGFQHDALNALGLESPLRGFELERDSGAVVDLAIASGPSVRMQLCGPTVRQEGEGVLTGYVVDKTGATLQGAVVRVRWLELALEKNNYHTVTRTVTAPVGEDGRYVACGVTSDDAVAVGVTKTGFRGLVGRISMPVGGAARQDFHLADSGVVSGAARLTGRVVLPDGSPLENGRAVIEALQLDVPVRNGEFSFVGLPPASWVVEARAIGYEPQASLVDVSEGSVASPILTLSERAQLLDVVTVLGKPGGATKILAAIASRRTSSVGSVFLRGNEWLESALDPADVVRGAAGFRYVSPEVVLASGCGFAYPPSNDPQPVPRGPPRQRTRTLIVYLNGARVVGGLPALSNAVNMREVLAVEAYQDVANAPSEWRTFDACAILAIWTKR